MSGLYDKRLDIRLTAEELGWIRDAAWRRRVSTSSWVRDALFAAAHEQGVTPSASAEEEKGWGSVGRAGDPPQPVRATPGVTPESPYPRPADSPTRQVKPDWKKKP